MLFRLRRKDGAADPYSAGTYIDARGRTTHLAHDAFSVTPGKLWKQYPIEWGIRVPSLGIDVQITTRLPQQEVESKQNRYWEGAGRHHWHAPWLRIRGDDRLRRPSTILMSLREKT